MQLLRAKVLRPHFQIKASQQSSLCMFKAVVPTLTCGFDYASGSSSCHLLKLSLTKSQAAIGLICSFMYTTNFLSETIVALNNHCQIWTRNAVPQKGTVCRTAIIPDNWKMVVLHFGDSCCNILHMEGLQLSRRQRMTWDSNTVLPLPQCDKTEA